MKHRFTFFFLLLLSLPVLAQRDFRPGFVVNASGDTLRGLVNFRESGSQNERCLFKANPSAAAREFTPETALGYGFFGDRLYETVALPRDSVTTEKRVFAWVLVRGRADLLAVGPQFYARKSGELHALKRSWKEVYVGNRWYKAEDREYERLLIVNLMADCPSIQLANGGGVDYSAYALARLFEVYNRCFNAAEAPLFSAKPWVKWEWSAYGGGGISAIALESRYYGSAGTLSTGPNPVFGLQGGFSAPRLSERVSAHLGFFYQSLLFSGTNEIQIGSTAIERSDIFVRVRSIQIPLLARYRVPLKNLSFFGQGGIATRINATTSAWYQTESELRNVISTERGDFARLKSGVLGLLVGAGLHANLRHHLRLTTEVRYEHGVGDALEEGVYGKSKAPSSWSLLVGIGHW